MKTHIRSGAVQQISGAPQKYYVEVKTKTRTYVLQESEQGKCRINIVQRKDNQIFEDEGPFNFVDGIGELFLYVLTEETRAHDAAKLIPRKQSI